MTFNHEAAAFHPYRATWVICRALYVFRELQEALGDQLDPDWESADDRMVGDVVEAIRDGRPLDHDAATTIARALVVGAGLLEEFDNYPPVSDIADMRLLIDSVFCDYAPPETDWVALAIAGDA